MYKVSIIIPVYNASAYIEACLASLIAQTMNDIEVILVDDHGTDDSLQIARAYVETHPSNKLFRFLATPYNMGPGAARNIGIDAAQGEYIAFVDSDDVVTEDFCERLYATAKMHNADLAYCHAKLIRKDEDYPMNNPIIENGEFNNDKRRFFLTHYTTLFVSYLYRYSLLNEYGIRFPNTRSAEDSYFLTCSLLVSNRIACANKPMYYYLLHEESLSESRNSKRYLDKVKSFDLLMQFAKEKGVYETNKSELDYIYLKKGYLLGLLTYIYNEEHPSQLTVRKLYNHLLCNVPDYNDNIHYRSDYKSRLLHTFIKRSTRLAFKLLPCYIRKSGMKL